MALGLRSGNLKLQLFLIVLATIVNRWVIITLTLIRKSFEFGIREEIRFVDSPLVLYSLYL